MCLVTQAFDIDPDMIPMTLLLPILENCLLRTELVSQLVFVTAEESAVRNQHSAALQLAGKPDQADLSQEETKEGHESATDNQCSQPSSPTTVHGRQGSDPGTMGTPTAGDSHQQKRMARQSRTTAPKKNTENSAAEVLVGKE